MKKIVCLFIAVLTLCAMVIPASATGEFVPSISYKDNPDVVEPPVLVDPEGEELEKLDMHCLEITPVSEAIKTKEDQRTDVEKLLVEVYEKLSDGSMKLPFEGDNADKMVVRDLIDATLVCGDVHTDPSHVEELAKPGVCIEITFDLGVEAGTEVVVMTYVDDQWNPAEKVTNNGNGTVTVIFEQICPIAFCVEQGTENVPPQTGDQISPLRLVFWGALLLASAAAVVILLIPRRKKKQSK